jgi:divalent metal cation (Fe/Co/Zn/Cd) transporter
MELINGLRKGSLKMAEISMNSREVRLFKYAFWLGIFTIVYNLFEGFVSIYFGATDESLTLFGFGIDSFIEVLSGIGIVAMVIRIERNPSSPRSNFERTALRITGFAFYLLSVGLVMTIIYNLYTAHKPTTTTAGVIIAIVSIAIMWLLVLCKRKVGQGLNSAPILADANCTMICIYMSLVLLASSFIYQLSGIGFIDSLGAAGLVYFSIKEGREAFEKANGIECACEDHD